MASSEASRHTSEFNNVVRHNRTGSTTSSASSNDERGLVLSVANLKSKRPSSGNNNASVDSSGPNSLNSGMGQSEVNGDVNHAVDADALNLTALVNELEETKQQLKLRDTEVTKLSTIRDEVCIVYFGSWQ